jgi:hypothetical protein
MPYRHSAARIHEIVKAPKALVAGQSVEPKRHGSHGLSFEAFVELAEGSFLDIRYKGVAGVSHDPTSYDASLRLDQQRVRGSGHCAVGRQNFRAKQRIPAGWHQNIVDPNLPTNAAAHNRHEALPDFAPTDFSDFTRRVAGIWNIDLGWEGGLL